MNKNQQWAYAQALDILDQITEEEALEVINYLKKDFEN